MKLKYIIPQTEVISMTATNMLALSASLDTSQSITSSDDFGVREQSFDDDDIW